MTRPFIFSVLFFSIAAAPFSTAAPGNPPLAQPAFSANDFDWREMVPYLYQAANEPGEQGLKTMLENSKVFRVYVARQVRADCRRDSTRCDPARPGFSFDNEVNKRIDGIVREELTHQHKDMFVNYVLADSPFPFSAVSVLKSDNHADAYFVLEFAAHTCTGQDLQSKYGAPDDTDVFDRYGVFKYKIDAAEYKSRAVFEIDPVNGEVMKIAISLKAKKHH